MGSDTPTGYTALISAAASKAYRAGEEKGQANGVQVGLNADNAQDARVDNLAKLMIKLLGFLLIVSIVANIALTAMVFDAKLGVSKEGIEVNK